MKKDERAERDQREGGAEKRNGSGQKKRSLAVEEGAVGESRAERGASSCASMAQSVANGVDQDLVSKRLHSR